MTEAQEYQLWRNFTHAYLTAIAQGTLIPETPNTEKGSQFHGEGKAFGLGGTGGAEQGMDGHAETRHVLPGHS